MSETKLKPCPFCSRDELHGQSCIKCSNCGAQSGWHENDKDAIAAWNTRPLEDELLEALKFVQEHCQLYGAADAARERIDKAIAHYEGRQ